MGQNIEGEYPPIVRVLTGLHSLDSALAGSQERGVPMTSYEIFGFHDVGKTIWSTSVGGIVSSKLNGNIIYLPIEHVDRDLMESILDSVSFSGKTTILGGWDMAHKFTSAKKSKETPVPTDEINIDAFLSALRMDDYVFGIVDSLSAIDPVSEVESSSVENNISGARRAKLTSSLARGIGYARRFRDKPLATVLLSHKVNSMSMFPTNSGSPTTGGEAKKNLSKVRILLKRQPEKTLNDMGHFVIQGTVEKLSFGREKRKFYNVVLGGQGIHLGMTALYDCKMYGLATFGTNITMGGEKYGAMRTIVDKALSGDDEFFQPFIDALKNPSSVGKTQAEEDELESWDDELPE